jgi:uncharacterized membrane protein YeiB
MVVVNFKIVMGAEASGPNWLLALVELLNGRAAATFVILAGIGISLLSRSGRVMGDGEKLKKAQKTLLRRALFLFVVGLLYSPIWPADILHFYGIYIAVAAFLLSASTRKLWIYCGLLSIGAGLLILIFDYNLGWEWQTLEYKDFWSPEGMVRHLFFNGFHPVIPWLSFLLLGMILGRQDLRNPKIRRPLFWWGVTIAIVAESFSQVLIQTLSPMVPPQDQEGIAALFGTNPMPPMPLYLLAGAGTAVALITASVGLGERYGNKSWLRPLVSTGQLALTLYVGHVLLGMGILEGMGRLENQSLTFSLGASFLFCTLGVLFAHLWRKRFQFGPIEWAMRVLT